MRGMKGRIAIVDDELTVCRRLGDALAGEGFEVETFGSAASFLERLKLFSYHVVFVDMKLPDMDGLELLRQTRKVNPDSEIIVVTGYGSIESAVDATRLGAFHYATKPIRLKEIKLLARSAMEKAMIRQENRELRASLRGDDVFKRIIGNSPAMQAVFDIIRKVAPLDCNVLLQGMSGTGKELVAKAIHQLSQRKNRPFVSFNCGGFTEELITSELFGYEKGAFTGAGATKIGLMESATGGTVFLDEIGEMPLSMQVKLLHVIQERRILRVGGIQPIHLDIRIIAASNKDLKKEVAAGNFREDLFYRLNVVTIPMPTLVERAEDIPVLISHFINKYNLAFGKKVGGLSPQAEEILMRYDYPGNVRELENIIERAVALTDSTEIQARDLPPDLQHFQFDALQGDGLLPLAEMEKRYIARVLAATGYNKSLTAQILQVPRTTLWRKIKKFGL